MYDIYYCITRRINPDPSYTVQDTRRTGGRQVDLRYTHDSSSRRNRGKNTYPFNSVSLRIFRWILSNPPSDQGQKLRVDYSKGNQTVQPSLEW